VNRLKTELSHLKACVDVSIRLVDFVIASIKRGLISKSEGRKLLDNIVEADFHINVRIYRKILEAMERL
jgi:predicted nucleic acid-binding protein